MANTPEPWPCRLDGDKLQKLTTSIAAIDVEMKSLRELLVYRFDTIEKSFGGIEKGFEKIDRDNEKRDLAIVENNKKIGENKLKNSQTATWMTIIGSIISIAVALSYLIH